MATSSRASRSGAASPARPRGGSRAASSDDRAAVPATADDEATGTLATPTTDALRRLWIAEAAYYIAERRGFRGGSPDEDWCEAEAEIDRMLAGPRH